ncbi:MAG: ubiquinone/menaquinone biosynthesis methyltransferase [Longimicrobiales bacterium]
MPSTRQTSEALPSGANQADAVRRMFGAIAGRYDLLNHLLSLNQDRRWRRRAVDLLLSRTEPAGRFLDGCAGTLDLALELASRHSFRGDIVAFDFAAPMLQAGSAKRRERPVRPVCADALVLPFPNACFDGATVGFGIRNLADIDAGLAELARVLRPGAPLVVLEFTTPGWAPFRALYLFYFLRVLPAIGRLVSRHPSAYAYLPASVLQFPAPAELGQRMSAVGFGDIRWETYSGGILAAHIGTRA